MSDVSWSEGVLIGLPVAGFAFLLVLGFAWFLLKRVLPNTAEFDQGPTKFLGCASVLVAVLIVGGSFWAMYPYSSEYHQFRPVSGEVSEVSSRFSSDSSGTSQRFVLQIDGQAYGCDDARCSAVKPGDLLELSCKREWQYTGVDGYGCKFVSSSRG